MRLYVNIDHVATLREARKTDEPDAVLAAAACERAGADGITVHLREDRRHIQDADVKALARRVRTVLNLELGANDEIVRLATRVQPFQATLVPEKRQEITTEGGLALRKTDRRLHGVRFVGLARFTERRNVIDVDVETHGVLPSDHPDHRACLVKRRLAVHVVLLAALTACSNGQGPETPVPQSMNESVAQFLAAVKANDLKRMGELWGTERGPAAQSMNGDVLRQRLTVIQKYLDHTGYRVIEGPLLVPGHQELRTYRVELQRASCNQVMPMDLIKTHSGGWLVYDVHLEAAGSPAGRCQPAATGTRP